MRGRAEEHEIIAPDNLHEVLQLLAVKPGEWIPIAGGTEIMVAHAAGRLAAKKLVSLWGISDLRFITVTDENIVLGSGTTFSDIRNSTGIANDLPMLAKAATWIGSIANQNRATIGGNLVNGSPAADSSPALLAYDAEIEMISARGKRRVAYKEFHTGYKKNVMELDELLFSVHIPRRFIGHRQYLRKVGTRRAMAISKVALGATALMAGDTISEIRLAGASLAAYPTRLYRAEDALCGRSLTKSTMAESRAALLTEIVPIDDIRSTAKYRRQVAANLLEEFLLELMRHGATQ